VGFQNSVVPCEQARSGSSARLSGSVLRSIQAIRGGRQAYETGGVDEFVLDPALSKPCGVPKVGAALRAGRIELSTVAHGALGPPAQPNATSAGTSTYAG
jgi:hypothetical protein